PRCDAERRVRAGSAQAPQAAGADRTAAAPRRSGPGNEGPLAIGRAQGSDAAGAARGRGLARRRAASASPSAGNAARGANVKLLVTVATGFLGSTLVPMLVEAGHEVRVLARSAVSLPDVEVVKGDVRDLDSMRRGLHGCEALYHLAG